MVAKPESVIGAKGAIQTMKKKQKTTAEVQAAIFRREHRKSPLRGGVKLTLKKARELALQEFGTAKGIQQEEKHIAGLLHNAAWQYARADRAGHLRRDGVHSD